jgi:hypothetical protein
MRPSEAPGAVRSSTAFSAIIVLGLCAVLGRPSEAAVPTEVSLFTITKSENRNFVQYGIRLDAQCVPVPANPVYAYWRMLEQGPSSTAPLLGRELRAYGMANQQIVSPVTPGAVAAVRVVLAAVPDRPVLVEIWRTGDGACRALPSTRIAGAPAHLFNVYVRLKWPLNVDYFLLQGWAMDGTHRVEEKVSV